MSELAEQITEETWQDGVAIELTNLTDKIVRLRWFIAGQEFLQIGSVQRLLLLDQSEQMAAYADTLVKRLEEAKYQATR